MCATYYLIFSSQIERFLLLSSRGHPQGIYIFLSSIMHHSIFRNVILLTLSLLASAAPTATTLNGTYEGITLPTWDQDAFLGIPYAQPPLGPLRFRWPQSINSSFAGTRNATQYGFSCMQYGTTFALSEDCLTLNVVRPSISANSTSSPLPVLVW